MNALFEPRVSRPPQSTPVSGVHAQAVSVTVLDPRAADLSAPTPSWQGRAATPFGTAWLAGDECSLWALQFLLPRSRPGKAQALAGDLPSDDALARDWVARIQGEQPGAISLTFRGTTFQIKVWTELLRLEHGRTTSYADLAERITRPGAARAVGNAVGANPIAWVVPCHRVLRADGSVGGFAYGSEAKLNMLRAEGLFTA